MRTMMNEYNNLKLFISYSHEDNKEGNLYIEEFKKHITPLKTNGLIEDWYDREILPGKNFNDEIENNLEEADIICLFISSNFISSPACQEEKKKAFELRKRKGTRVIPIILSPCAWQDDFGEYSKILALPTDAKPVVEFENSDKAWLDVYVNLKKIVEYEIKVKLLKIKKEFEVFLQDTEILSKAHAQKETVLLGDIFIYPELDEYDNLREFKRKISSKELIENFCDYQKVVISGAGQSGKSTLCKIIFKELRMRNLIPVYVFDKEYKLSGLIENRILKSYDRQYEGIPFDEIDLDRVVPIIDDFHLAKQKEKHIKALSKYPFCVLIVDDIFSLNIKDEELISSFTYFMINELKPSLRYELIKKWACLRDPGRREIELYKEIDQKWELINQTLGKIFGKGIMPAYPFFILSTIKTYETFAIPLNQEITSLGYCYQALIYFYLIKRGVKNDEIDMYLNFLTELAYYFYKEGKKELSSHEINKFMNYYKNKFILHIKEELIIKKLDPVVSMDSFGNYFFSYPYIYYFFVSKYLADNADNKEIWKHIENIMENLHVDENAYVAIFLVHHTKDIKILDELELNAMCLFDKYIPASLTKDEVSFFDEQVDIIIKASLPPSKTTPEKRRQEILEIQDQEEEEEEKAIIEEENSLENDLRRAIRTAEVIGAILKNRGGSLEKTKAIELFEEAMNIHLRILSSFFGIIKDREAQKSIIGTISKALEEVVTKKRGKVSKEELERIARSIFWNFNFFVVYGIIHKTAYSLGSDKLIEIIENVDKKIRTPVSFLVKEKILMCYLKNLKIDEIVRRIEENDFSYIAKNVIKLMVANYCSLHPINYKDRQKIEKQLGIPTKKFLAERYKKNE